MGRKAEEQPLFAHSRGQIADHVALRAHFDGGPVRQAGVVHGEAVVMLGHGNDVARAGFLEKLRPGRRVPLFRRELRDQILVAELVLMRRVLRRKVFLEILVRAFFGPVHVARIPLIFRAGHRIHAPMDEDAEFRVLVPLRNLIVAKALPIGPEGPVVGLAFCFLEQRIALRVVFSDGLLPFLVDLLGGLGVGRGHQRIDCRAFGLRLGQACGEKQKYREGAAEIGHRPA